MTVSNYDVFKQVSNITDNANARSTTQLGDFYAITHELSTYLSTCMPSTKHDPSRLVHELSSNYPGLAKAEKMSIVNTAPRNLCILTLLIEESDERFSEEEMMGILALVQAEIPEQT